MVDIAVVILNWNGLNFLKEFLPGIVKNTYLEGVSFEVIVADNASTDGSVTFLKTKFSDIRLIQLDKNYGFAKGYDLALKQIEAHFFVLLNSDIEVPSGWLAPIYLFLKANNDVAVVMPKIRWQKDKEYFEYAGAAGGYMDKFGYTFCRGRIFDTIEKDTGQYDDSREIFWATGACFAIRSEVFISAGGLDHRFFAHMEEIDLCWRIARMGYKIYYVPDSEVFHVGGGTLPSTDIFKTYLNFRNNLMLLFKNLPSNALITTILQRLILDFIAAVYMLIKGNFKGFISVFKAHWSFYRLVPQLAKERNEVDNLIIKDEKKVYQRSIVFDHFFRKKRYFHQLNM